MLSCSPGLLSGWAWETADRAQVVNSPFAIKHNQEEICVEPAALADK